MQAELGKTKNHQALIKEAMLALGPKRIPRTPFHNGHNSEQRRAEARDLQTERTHLRRIVADADLSVAGLAWRGIVPPASEVLHGGGVPGVYFAIHLPYKRQHNRVASTSKTQPCLLLIRTLTWILHKLGEMEVAGSLQSRRRRAKRRTTERGCFSTCDSIAMVVVKFTGC
jgi:hypothetical protein